MKKLEEPGVSYSADQLNEALRIDLNLKQKLAPTTMNNYIAALLLHFPIYKKKKSSEEDGIKYSLNTQKLTSIRSDLEERLENAVRGIDLDPLGPGTTIEKRRGLKFDRLLVVLEKLMERKWTISELESELKDEFKMSRKSIERDIQALSSIQSFLLQEEEDLDDPRKMRYFVDKNTIVRGRLDVKQQLALAMAQLGSPLGSSFRNILKQVAEKALRAAQPALDADLMDAFVFTTAGDDSAEILHNKLLTLAEARYQKRCVKITYRTLGARITERKDLSEVNERIIEPAYLFPAMDGLFYVMAFCQLRNEWRIFAVDQILTCESTYKQATKELSQDKKSELNYGWGPFLGDKEEIFIIRFSPQIRPYIERRRWHVTDTPKTKKPVNDEVFGEGSLELMLTTTGSEGVKHWLKQWIPDFRVIEPQWLKDELEEEMNNQLEIFNGRPLI